MQSDENSVLRMNSRAFPVLPSIFRFLGFPSHLCGPPTGLRHRVNRAVYESRAPSKRAVRHPPVCRCFIGEV
jgi:hypothetical protein